LAEHVTEIERVRDDPRAMPRRHRLDQMECKVAVGAAEVPIELDRLGHAPPLFLPRPGNDRRRSVVDSAGSDASRRAIMPTLDRMARAYLLQEVVAGFALTLRYMFK